MDIKKTAPTTVTSSSSVTTRCFNDHGDCLAMTLRPWNLATADDREELLVPRSTTSEPRNSRVASRGRRSTRRSIHAGGPTTSPSQPTSVWSSKSKTSCFGHRVGAAGKPLVRHKSFHYQADSWTTARTGRGESRAPSRRTFARGASCCVNYPIRQRTSRIVTRRCWPRMRSSPTVGATPRTTSVAGKLPTAEQGRASPSI